MGEQFFYDVLDSLGYRIEHTDLSHLGRLGDCAVRKRLIRIDETATTREYPYVLGHETKHAINGDIPTMFGHFDALMERQADEWSALHNIDFAEYREVEREYGGHVPTMAFHLGIVDEAVEVFQSMLTRVGGAVYLQPRMGAGNWTARLEAVA